MSKRKNYVNNMCPVFNPPKNDKKRPAFINYALGQAKKIDVARSELNYILQPKDSKTGSLISRISYFLNVKFNNVLSSRHRQLNEHRAAAMRAIVPAMVYHFNITSNLVQASIEQLADECGLSTISKSGNKSITRVSRLISEFMEPMGFIKCEKRWDKILGCYMPKIITLTPLFFELFGVSKEKLKNAKKQQLGWINKKLSEKGLKTLSLEDAKLKSKENQLKRILESRSNLYLLQRKKRYAKRLFRLDEKCIRQRIIKHLISKYSILELNKISLQEFKKQVNMEYFYLRNLANGSYLKEKSNFCL
uniref:RepA1 protein n=1 Tax=Buchnera aphidicola TaxID=9 RepID=Q9F4E0_9GAMM|nr:RepA1 protein [Buchnera aphidicola]